METRSLLFIVVSIGCALPLIIGATSLRNRRGIKAPSILPTECGISSVQTTKIVGGREALVGAWPWIVALYILGEPDCGGVLVTNRHVVTASHCVVAPGDKTLPTDRLRVRVGEHNLDETVDDGATPQDVEVEEILSHKDFSHVHLKNDIAILKLKTPVRFRKHVRAICLPYSGAFESRSVVGEEAYVAGWGVWNLTNRARSSALREVQVPIWKDEECQKAVRVSSQNIYCAGFRAGGRDSCRGDSGGPLMLKDESDKFYLLGVVSHGVDCAKADHPGVYTNVRNYLEWISNHLK